MVQGEAHACETEISAIDEQARQVIKRTRDQYPGGRLSSRGDFPAPPAELVTLQQKREAIIQGHVTTLQTKMGQSPFAKLDSTLQSRFAKQVHSNTLPVAPRTRSSRNQSLEPLNR